MNVETWDDFRFVLAVSRAGTLTSAAERLGCDQTTVTRRLKALEERLEMTLFDRLRGGIELTSVGEAFARTAELLED
jgi:DNA-binding transcriptional LysR family regulator